MNRLLLIFLILVCPILSFSQIVETDSTLEVHSDFTITHSTNYLSFYLVPKFNSTCFKKDTKYQYNHNLGEKVVSPPYITYTTVCGVPEKDSIPINGIDTIIVVHYMGSSTDKYYTISISHNTDKITLNIFLPNGNKCDTRFLDKKLFSVLLIETDKKSIFPPYECYTKSTFIKAKK